MNAPLDQTSLRKALASFDASMALVNDRNWLMSQSDAVRNTLNAGAIQNFEFVYELSVKMLRRQLEREAASPTEVDESSFRKLLRVAGEKGMIADVESWFGYQHARDAHALLAAMQARHV